jgi:hypothetical protein
VNEQDILDILIRQQEEMCDLLFLREDWKKHYEELEKWLQDKYPKIYEEYFKNGHKINIQKYMKNILKDE